MGLDQYLYIQDSSQYCKESYDSSEWNPCDGHNQEISGTWRKFDELHDVMAELWKAKIYPFFFSNSEDDTTEFNCVFLQITVQELESAFRKIDSEFDEDIHVDYSNGDEYDNLSNAEFYRNHNHSILEKVKDNPNSILLYKSWY